MLAAYAASMVDSRPIGRPGDGELISFPKRPARATPAELVAEASQPEQAGNEQMLVRANEINYDHTNDRVAAVGNVQIYYSGATLEADRVIYDQKTKRVHAEGNVKLNEANGRVTYGEIINLSDDFRDGFVDSLQTRHARPDPDGRHPRRPQRRQHHGPPKRRLHRLRGVRRRPEEAARSGRSRPPGSSTIRASR